jgi:Metallopeptidase family M24
MTLEQTTQFQDTSPKTETETPESGVGIVPGQGPIPIHGEEGFVGMRKAGRLTAEALDYLVDIVKPGITTNDLDRLIVEFAKDHNAICAPLGYRGYPKSICTSAIIPYATAYPMIKR